MTNTPIANTGNVPVLIALLDRQRALYELLCAMSREQSQLIETAQTESLLSHLAQRQKLIDEVTAVNAELDPYRRRWAEIWADLNPADRERVGGLVRGVETLLASILKRDDEDRKALQSAKARVAEQMRSVSNAGVAVNAYRSASTPAAKPPGIGQGANRYMNQQG